MNFRNKLAQDRISKKFIILCIILPALIVVLLPFFIRPIVFANVNSGSESLIDPNYGTEEYWDKEYGTSRTYIDQSYFSAGKTITTGDYFIKSDITVNGKSATGDTDSPGAGISISGNVRFFLERSDVGQPGPTLTFTGGNSCNAHGSAPGIELTQGNSLTFQGVGIVNASGGKWYNSGSSSYPQQNENGQDGYRQWVILFEFYNSGNGGSGTDGLGGTGAAIGTFGGNGGSGAKGPSGHQCTEGTQSHAGTNGPDGSNGGNSSNAGTLKSFGNVIISAEPGTIDGPNWKWGGGQDGIPCWIGDLFGLAGSTGGGGGGGAMGGAGWRGAAIGSGGGGGGGGGAGGSGGCEYFNAWRLFNHRNVELCGGGAGCGASGVYRQSGNGECCANFAEDVRVKPGYGEEMGWPTDLNNNNGKGGSAAIQDLYSPNNHSGAGGDGGLGGLSGKGGYYYSSLIDSIASNACANRATGTSSTYLRRFIDSLCKISFVDSLVDWCGAYVTNEKDPVMPENFLYNFPSGTSLVDDNHDRTSVKYEDNIKAGHWATVTHTGINTADEGYVLCNNTVENPGSVKSEFYLVRKGAVDVDLNMGNIEYTGQPISIDTSKLNVSFEEQDVTSEIKSADLVQKFYRVEGDKLIELEQAPKDAGNYKAEVYVFSDDYIGKSEIADFTINKKDVTIHALTTFHNEGEPEPELKASVHGVVQGESLTKDTNFTLTLEPIVGQEHVQLIKVNVIDPSPYISNYNITTKDGYCFERSAQASAKLSVVNSEEGEDLISTYGSPLPQIKVKAEGFGAGDVPQIGVDYEVVYDTSAKDVGEYPVYIVLLASDITLYYNIELVSNKIVINKKDATLTVVDNNKTYGDSDPDYKVNVDGLVYGESFTEGTTGDYTINRYNGNPSEDVGEHLVRATVKEKGPVSKNYNVTAIDGTLTINKRDARVWAEDIINGYGLVEKPLVFNQGNDLIWGEKLNQNSDYTINREHGQYDPEEAGDYTITVTVIENGPVAKNYNITAETGTYTIRAKTAIISADDKSSIYGEQDKELTVTTQFLDPGDTLKKGVDYNISREQGRDVGTYTINIEIIKEGPVSQSYYFKTINPGTYTITQKSAVLVADDKEQEYGENQVALTVSSEDYAYDDKLVEGQDYTISRADSENINVGEYVISAVVLSDGPVAKNYNFTTQNGTYVITKAPATIVPRGGFWNWKYYGDADPEFKADVSGLKYDDEFLANVDYVLYRDDGEEKGSHKVKSRVLDTSIANNYDVDTTATGDFTIWQFTYFDEADVEPLKEPLVYNGEPLCPDFNVTFDFGRINDYERNGSTVKKFEKGIDYEIEYINNDKPGTATAIISGINSCYGTMEMTFDIIAAPNTESVVYNNTHNGTSNNEVVHNGTTTTDDNPNEDDATNQWIILVAILCSVCVLFGLGFLVYRKRKN